ncbi:uncharacterized protein [Antedon mediterranea]|uniref:uncharacterized protein n=1 Tax=Antedon mediterranea TaxID=105859 RepID=UPI003AF691E4
MTDLLVPDTPAGQRSNRWQDEVVEPSCCGPVRSKINTTPIKLHSIMYIVCGVLSIGLGIVACVFECLYNGLSIPAGVLLIATGVVGLCVRKHGALAIVYGCLNPFCFLYGIALLVFMLVALPVRESDWKSYCSSYDCKWDYYYDDGCCYATKYILRWKNAGIDLAILVVGVIVMVTSLAATTLSLRDLNWVKLCCLKKNMSLGQGVDSGSEPSGQSSPAMKPCWTPCVSNGHRNATIILSIIHIIIGVISVGLGIGAIIVECRFAHIGMPIWTGILIFMVTGFYGFQGVTEKGAYIPCFFALSMLAFLMSINMFSWAAVSIPEEGNCAPKCLTWCTTDTHNSNYPYWYSTPEPRRYCCEIDYDFCTENTEEVVLDSVIIFFGVLEMLVCMATFGLSFSQLSCYFCCRDGCSTCKCCETKTNTAYQMVMTTDGNMMMVAVPNTQHGMTPSLVNNQQMIPQPMVIPANQLIAGQNQTSGSVPPNTDGRQLLVQGNGQPQPMMVQGQRQPMVAKGQVKPMVVQGQSQPMMLQGQLQPIVIQGQRQSMVIQGQVQPMVVQEQSQPMMTQGQSQPMMIQGQRQPMLTQEQVQPIVVQGQRQPMMVQGQVQPMVVQEQSQPMMTQGQSQPMMIQGQSQPMMTQGQSQPMMVPGQSQPMIMAQGQVQPIMVQRQGQPMIVQTHGQGMVASGHVSSQPGIPTQSMFIQQPVVTDGQDAGVVQSQMQQNNQPAPQSQLTNQTVSTKVQAGSLPQGVESPAVVSEDANQGIGVISNPTV